MSATSPLKKIAIIGASGHIGSVFAKALVQGGQHIVTALTRDANNNSGLPAGVQAVQVDYDDDGTSLVSALKGQQFLAITLPARAPPGLHAKIVEAAARAGVPYVMPNIYGFETADFPGLPNSQAHENLKTHLESLKDRIASIYMVCGFWYEWSLACGNEWFGFDIANRKVTMFDDGKTVIAVSTWEQCGRALAALLQLPESGASPAVEDWKNKTLYISSFRVSQRIMLDSLHRVLGTSDADWEITYEPSAKRYEDGMAAFAAGEMMGFVKAMYSKVLFPDGKGDHETLKGVVNKTLGLPEESLDEATKRAVDMVMSGWKPF